MRPSAKVAGFACLVAGLAVGVFIGLLIAHRGGQRHEQGGKPADEADPEVSAFFKPTSDLLGEFTRGGGGLSPVGPAHCAAGSELLFDHQMERWYCVCSHQMTLDPKAEQLRINPVGELKEKLTALARQKGVVVKSAGDDHAGRHLSELEGGVQTVGPLTGKNIFIMEAREGFRYHYATGKSHGIVQVQMDYLGKRGKGDEEVALYYYEARVEEWFPARKP
jgi:hypothetical protein